MELGLQVFLDGLDVHRDEWVIRTIGDLIQHVQDLPQLKNRFIESISVDGVELYDWEDNRSVDLPPTARIEIKTLTGAELLASTVQTAREYLPKLRAGAVTAAELFQEGRDGDALNLVRQLVEGLQWYSDFLGSVSVLLPHEQERVSERLTALNGVMDELVKSWEDSDHTLLADVLEYALSVELQENLHYVDMLARSRFVDWESSK